SARYVDLTMDLQTNDILTAEVGRRIFDAVLTLDEDALRAEFARARDEHGVDALVADVLVPALHHVGVMWSAGELSVMHEHHASNIVRSVVSEFRGEAVRTESERDARPRVVLTCPPGELHDLPNHLFSSMLVERGWAPLVLGANTPWAATSAAVRATSARACVISGMKATSFAARRSELTVMARSTLVYVAGPGATLAGVPGVVALGDDWREAADVVTGRLAAPLVDPAQVPRSA
ncbi:cobalamin B12-binding domain-containing protein, partial [Dermacoccus nishinomiyaensis]|uniref:cobalamin B12-binding domain-containing protein n=1 Tax=Dermacoccus nishinomiyaensis TaxID=1274 RepID=UPI0028A85ED2